MNMLVQMLFHLATELPSELITFRRRRRGGGVMAVVAMVIGSRKRGE
jgi:hypothetical protein